MTAPEPLASQRPPLPGPRLLAVAELTVVASGGDEESFRAPADRSCRHRAEAKYSLRQLLNAGRLLRGVRHG